MSHTIEAGRLENALLLACAARAEPGGEERIRALLGGPVDWPYLTWSAARHGVLPLIWRRMLAACPDLVPGAITAGWRESYIHNARRNVFLAGELLRLLALFGRHGITAVPYKGPTLAALAYGDITLRDFCDNDIMICREDLPRAKALMLAEGYRPEIALTPAQEAAYVLSRHSLVFADDRGSIVELHWALQPRYFAFDMDPAALRARLHPVRVAGRTVMTFSREDLLQILCLHGAKHMWGRLEWICDVAELIQTDGALDWARILDESRRLGARRMVLLGLHLAQTCLAAAPPPEIARAAQADPLVAALADRVVRRLFSAAGPPGIFESSAFYVRTRERLRDRARYVLRWAMTPYLQDWAVIPLPPAMSPLYYVIRPFRMLARHTAAALRRG